MRKCMRTIAVVLAVTSTYANAQSSNAKNQRLTLSLVESVQPVYPEDARRQGIHGVVSLRALVGVDGTIKQLAVVSGPSLLRPAALDAVRQWRYRPVLKDGKPVSVATIINVNFALTSSTTTTVVPVTEESAPPAQASAGTLRPNPHSSRKSATTAATLAERPPRPASPEPVFFLDLATALAQGESAQTLAAEVTTRGVDLYFDDGDEEYFQLLGATDQLVHVLRSSRFIFVDYASSSAKWQAQAARDETSIREVENKRPDDAAIHWLVAAALQFEEKSADAVSEARKAVSLKSDFAQAHQTLAELLLESGQKEEALSEAKEAVRLMPGVARPHVILGYALAQNGHPQDAIAEEREAVQVEPGDDNAHSALAGVLLDQKNADEAVHEFREAVRLNPNSPSNHLGLGRALYMKPDYDGAAFEFKKAIRLRPRDPKAVVWLAAALLSAGRFEEAAAEAHTALMYDPKASAAEEMLAYARGKLRESAGPTAGAQVVQATQPAASGGLAGSTWACQETDRGPDHFVWNYSISFLDSGIVKKDEHNWGETVGMDARWQLNGSTIQLLMPENIADNYEGTLTSPTTITGGSSHKFADNPQSLSSLNCTRQTPIAPPPSAPAASQPSVASNHPPYDDKCIRLGPGTLGAVSFTNICSEPIDLKWCYRQHGVGGDWHCTVTPKLFPNHTLASPSCYRCSYDGRAAAYLSSRNLLGDLPSDAEVASWTGSGPPQSASNKSSNSGSSDGQRQWRLVSPSQNWDTLTFEIHGRNGDSTSDDFNDETPIRTITLKPGESWTEDCGGYFSLDIKWVLASSSDPQTDIYYASLLCYANNFVWNNNHNLREYDFPRQ